MRQTIRVGRIRSQWSIGITKFRATTAGMCCITQNLPERCYFMPPKTIRHTQRTDGTGTGSTPLFWIRFTRKAIRATDSG